MRNLNAYPLINGRREQLEMANSSYLATYLEILTIRRDVASSVSKRKISRISTSGITAKSLNHIHLPIYPSITFYRDLTCRPIPNSMLEIPF